MLCFFLDWIWKFEKDESMVYKYSRRPYVKFRAYIPLLLNAAKKGIYNHETFLVRENRLS